MTGFVRMVAVLGNQLEKVKYLSLILKFWADSLHG